ncbi:hypothetical protein [Georgenia sp. Z1491]|uniref:hypothetical protein n=1 Tax=Georgenia sp. Z1491 TaxID=3416707 RepID=UPI003CE6C7D2
MTDLAVRATLATTPVVGASPGGVPLPVTPGRTVFPPAAALTLTVTTLGPVAVEILSVTARRAILPPTSRTLALTMAALGPVTIGTPTILAGRTLLPPTTAALTFTVTALRPVAGRTRAVAAGRPVFPPTATTLGTIA